jgi:MinD-like ATPase involved in chromosome partitioning or flagellar assembly/CheY-like chemotaxis protein
VEEITVLVIDANINARNYLSSMLTTNKYTVILAGSAKEGFIVALRDLPAIIIFDPGLGDMSATDFVRRLRVDRRTAATPIIALSWRNDPDEMTRLLSAGCTEYLVKSTPSVQKLVSMIPRLIGRGDLNQEREEGSLIVFLSAKGGTGTTSLCVNVADALARARSDKKVVVVDLVLPIGSIAPMIGFEDEQNIITATALPSDLIQPETFKDLPKVPNWHFHLIAGAPNPDLANDLSVVQIPEVIHALQYAYDYVVVDLGRSLSRISIPVMQAADVLTLVISNDASAFTLTRTTWDYVKSKGVNPNRVYTILNRVSSPEAFTRVEAEQAVGFLIQAMMPNLGTNFASANAQHVPLMQKFQGEAAAFSLQQISREIAELAYKVRQYAV